MINVIDKLTHNMNVKVWFVCQIHCGYRTLNCQYSQRATSADHSGNLKKEHPHVEDAANVTVTLKLLKQLEMVEHLDTLHIK